MEKWKRWLISFLAFVLLLGGGYVVVVYYSYVFSKSVEGRVVGVKREDRYEESYVVAIRTQDGNIYTTHSEDAQWALVRVGQCAKAKYLPYPPWNFKESGTYFGAKLLNLRECTEEDGTWNPDKYCPGGSQAIGSTATSSGGNAVPPVQSPSEKPKELPPTPEMNAPGEGTDTKTEEEKKQDEETNFQRIREKYLEGQADT